MSLAELEAQLKLAQSRDPKMSVAIKGDAHAQYAKVIAVIDLCNSLGVNMGSGHRQDRHLMRGPS